MTSDFPAHNIDEVTSLKNANRQLLENQSFLHDENQKLQDNVERLSRQLDIVKKSSIQPSVLETLKREKDNLIQINQVLNDQIKNFKTLPVKLSKEQLKVQKKEQDELNQCINELDLLITTVRNRPETLQLQPHAGESTVSDLTRVLTKRLEEEQRRSEEMSETIRKLRDDDEKHILRDKISDMKKLITDLEVEKTKLKSEVDCLLDDVQRYEKRSSDATKQAEALKMENAKLEEEKSALKERVSEIEHDNLRLKKEMIEELNEANRAKRVSVETEMALQHISEAYENKRKEVILLEQQLDEANKNIRMLQLQTKMGS